MSNTTIELPNPFTSLAWLPPSLAEQLEVARYLCCAVIGVSELNNAYNIIWSSLSNVAIGILLGSPYVAA